MPNLSLNLFIVFVIIIVIAVILTGLRILIQRFFDIFIEKKLFFIYSLFYTILLLVIFVLISQNIFGDIRVALFTILFLILTIAIVEYVLIYKRYFDFEPANKYIFCICVSYFFDFMLLVFVSNLLITVLALLFM